MVLHPGSALKGPVPPAIARAGAVIAECLAESESCPLHLEITAGAGGTLGRTFAELAELIDAAGGSERLGVCLDSCHLLASGYDVRTPESLSAVLDELEKELGLDRLGSLHLNDSQFPLGSNRDRHANLGEGELGETGLRGLPARAALPGPAVRARDARPGRQGHGGRGDRLRPAPARRRLSSHRATGGASTGARPRLTACAPPTA